MLLSACATEPNDFLGENIDEVTSHYGNPSAAYDENGARVFLFDPKNDNIPENENLLNPDLWQSPPKEKLDCKYAFYTIWTNARENWTVHGTEILPQCKLEEKQNGRN